MRELVEFLARNLVARPGEVRVREVSDGRTVRIEIRVAADEVGRLVGRQGRVIRAIRALARAAATRQGKRVQVDVVREDS